MAAKKAKTFVLRTDDATFAALEKWAADEFRSVNGQLEWLISQALVKAGRKKWSEEPVPAPISESENPHHE